MQLAKAEKLGDPYITAGDRAYVIGAQNGRFPAMGWHVEGEMGGVWTHPIKLLDGFWLQVDGSWLPEASSFTTAPFWTEHRYSLPAGLEVTQRQFVPDGEPAVVIRYTFRSVTTRRLKLRFLARSDLQPVWLADDGTVCDADDHAAYLADVGAYLCTDERNPWSVVMGAQGTEASNPPPLSLAHEHGRDIWGPEFSPGRGISATLDYELLVPENQETHLQIIIAGSDRSAESAVETFRRVGSSGPALWSAKAKRYDAMLRRSAIDIPDPPIAAAWDWIKCNYDWLVRSVPEFGRALGAGVPEYPWWFGCDSFYALLGCLALGQHEITIDTLDLLRTVSRAAYGDSGEVIHECTTRGRAVGQGNVQEVPQFVSTVWHAFRWTGDLELLRRSYDFCRRGLLEQTLGAHCPDGDLLPFGCGVVEIPHVDLQCIDVATHTVCGLAALSEMAGVLGDEEVRLRCSQLCATVRDRLEEAFWMEEEGLYGDLLATPAQMMSRLSAWLTEAHQPGALRVMRPEVELEVRKLLNQARSDPHPHRKRPWLCKNWTLVSPLEAGLAGPERAARALARLEGQEFTGRWGMYMSGIERSESMSINTGALAVAELRYGRVDQGLGLIRTIAGSLPMHMPGAISEVSPDGGCFVQAWSGYSVAWPLVTQVFGLQPEAHRRRLILTPSFPASWPSARLSNVCIGSASFDFAWDGHVLTVYSSDPTWTVVAGNSVPLTFSPPHPQPLSLQGRGELPADMLPYKLPSPLRGGTGQGGGEGPTSTKE